jgi:inner membrane protein
MPSEFTHIFVSGVLGKTYTDKKMPARFWLLAAICSVLPDVDVISYYLGVRSSSMLGHRGVFHSLTFALVAGAVAASFALPAAKRWSRQWLGFAIFFFVVTASHGLLDAMTDRGSGVGFLMPFDSHRFYLPWRPFHASPMQIHRFFSSAGLVVLASEIVWIWIPALLLYGSVRLFRKKQGNKNA